MGSLGGTAPWSEDDLKGLGFRVLGFRLLGFRV